MGNAIRFEIKNLITEADVMAAMATTYTNTLEDINNKRGTLMVDTGATIFHVRVLRAEFGVQSSPIDYEGSPRHPEVEGPEPQPGSYTLNHFPVIDGLMEFFGTSGHFRVRGQIFCCGGASSGDDMHYGSITILGDINIPSWASTGDEPYGPWSPNPIPPFMRGVPTPRPETQASLIDRAVGMIHEQISRATGKTSSLP